MLLNSVKRRFPGADTALGQEEAHGEIKLDDGVYDEDDAFPLDPCVSLDTDGDGEPDWVMTGLKKNLGSANAEGVEIPAPEPSGNKNLLGDAHSVLGT